MSFLLEKSRQNEHAVGILIDKLQYAPVAHCGYYSCLQRMAHILLEYETKNYNYIQTEYKAGRVKIHSAYLKYFVSCLRTYCKDPQETMSFDDLIKQLKEHRVTSDYNDEDFLKNKSHEVKEAMETIHQIIKKTFLV